MSEFLQILVAQLGLAGVFLVSLLGSASIIFPIPYQIVILLFSVITEINPLFIVTSAALGSTVGEVVGYFLGYTVKGIVKEETRRKFDYAFKVLSRYRKTWFLIVFIFALTPLPDDLLIIPLGILRFNFFTVFIPCLLGKLVMFSILVYGGRHVSLIIMEEYVSVSLPLIVASFVILFAIIICLWRIDWERLLKNWEVKGKKS